MPKNKKAISQGMKSIQQTGLSKKVVTREASNAKKEAVLGTGKKNRIPLIAVVSGLMTIAVIGYFYLRGNTAGSTLPSANVSPGKQATQVAYPVSLFEDGKARHFEFQNGDILVKYFVIKSSDGIIRAAFDACDVCWRAGKGYFQEGDHMVCRNCGRRFASVLVNEVKGGCNPAPLNRSVSNGNVVINIQDILSGKSYFNFS